MVTSLRDWQGDMDEAVTWHTIPPIRAITPSHFLLPSSLPLLIPIEKWRERKGGGGGGGGGATKQAKDSTDIHGNVQIYSVVIISVNTERQWQGDGRG